MKTTTVELCPCGNHPKASLPGSCFGCMAQYPEVHRPKSSVTAEEYERTMREASEEWDRQHKGK